MDEKWAAMYGGINGSVAGSDDLFLVELRRDSVVSACEQ